MNRNEGYRELEEKLSYHFKNPDLIISALTHSSYKNEKPHIRDYERLEFLGRP